jgi:hypothetical protein
MCRKKERREEVWERSGRMKREKEEVERGARLKSRRGTKEPGRGEDASAAGKARKKGKRAPVEKEAPWCV